MRRVCQAPPKPMHPAIPFIWKSILSMGIYPFFWAALRAPYLHRRAIILRAHHLENPLLAPSSWPWIRASWLAWFSTVALAMFFLMITSGFLFPLLRLAHSTTWALILLYGGLVLPQIIVLVELLRVVAYTIYPESIILYVQSRYQIALKRTSDRLIAFRNRKLTGSARIAR